MSSSINSSSLLPKLPASPSNQPLVSKTYLQKGTKRNLLGQILGDSGKEGKRKPYQIGALGSSLGYSDVSVSTLKPTLNEPVNINIDSISGFNKDLSQQSSVPNLKN